jgi:hypothetical protein
VARNAATAGDAGRRDKDEAPGLIVSLRREFGCNEPAERVSGDVGLFQTGGNEPAGQPRAQFRSRNDVTESWKIDDVHRPASRQRLKHRRPPSPGPCEPVHQHESPSGAGHAVSNRATVDLDLVQPGVLHLIRSGRCGHPPFSEQ